MKIQYIATLAVVSLLSFGAIAGCSGPAKNDTLTSPSATVQANSTKANPCASKTNPCAAKANPCASKTNPCAAKANPCASKTKTVGGPLAQQLQGKPVLIDIYASWCPACKNIAPTLSKLEQQYAGKVEFVVLDMTDKATTDKAVAKAKELGLSDFLAANKAQTGTLTIVDPATGQILAQHRNNANLADYTTVLDTALKQ